MGLFTFGPRARQLALQSAVVAAGLLVSATPSTARAANDAKDKGSAGSSGPASNAGESPGGGKTSDLTDTRDKTTDNTTTYAFKTWEVGLGFEYHHTGLDGDYINNDILRNVNYYSVYARWDPSPYDRVSASWGVYEYFLADGGESGVRSDDVSVKYTRRFPLPSASNLRLSFSATIPVSYASQLAGLITAPKFAVQYDKLFGRYFSIDARLTGGFYVVKYAEGGSSYNGGGASGFGIGENGGGANANPKGSFTMSLNGELAMPFHEPLALGLTLYTGYTWYYDVSNSSCPTGGTASSTPCMYGTVMQSTTQPFEQSYASEVYVRYTFPTVGGVKLDLSATYAPNGDGTLGYASVLNGNGVANVYPFYSRENAEVYFALNGRY